MNLLFPRGLIRGSDDHWSTAPLLRLLSAGSTIPRQNFQPLRCPAGIGSPVTTESPYNELEHLGFDFEQDMDRCMLPDSYIVV